jgi:signal transduction histidine kinase
MSDVSRLFIDAAATFGAGESAREMLTELAEQARIATHARTAMVRAPARSEECTLTVTVGAGDDEAVAPFAALLEGKTRPIRIAEFGKDAQFKSFLGVPLRLQSKIVGCFCLFDKDGGASFTEEDELLIELLSAHAAFALALLQRFEASQRRGRFFESLVAQSPDAMMFFDAANVLRYANAATARQWGGRPGAPHVGQVRPDGVYPWHRRGPPFTDEEIPSARALRGEIVERMEVELELPDHTRFDAVASAAPVRNESGEILGAVVTFRDVSAEVALERLRDEFAAIMVHDLRNPLSALVLSVERLLGKAEGDQVMAPVHVLERIDHLGRRLGVLVAELLDAARIEIGQLSLMPKVVDLPSAVSDLVDDLGPSLGDRSVEVETSGHPGSVFVDPLRFIQILTNLLENSAKYSLEGAPIRITLQEAQGGAVISVSDQGSGISPEDIPRLFDRFFQAQRARERRQTGLGLGLYITKGLVEASGGRIWVESEVGKGSTFRVWLPEPRPRFEHRESATPPI